jgi:hypothetical protein
MSEAIQLTTKQATLGFEILALCEQLFPEDEEIHEVLPVLKVLFEEIQMQVAVYNAR